MPRRGIPRRDPAAPGTPAAHGGFIGFVGVAACRGAGRGRPRRPLRKGGIAPSVGAISGRSCAVGTRLGRGRAACHGPSVTRWRLVPALPRSVGFGPVADPLFSPTRSRCRRSPGSNRSRPPHAGVRAAPMQAPPYARDLPVTQPARQQSCRSRSSSRPAASPRGC